MHGGAAGRGGAGAARGGRDPQRGPRARAHPDRRRPDLLYGALAVPGAAAGVALWIAASAGFSLYLDHFASYNRVYGTLGAAVAFLVWAWIMNLALLVGVEVNREAESRHTWGRSGEAPAPAGRGESASV